MYTDFRQLVEATLEKYKDATSLSKNTRKCYYSHAHNGVGCAIGCHLTPEKAQEVQDGLGGHGFNDSVSAIIGDSVHAKEKAILAEVFDFEKIDLLLLRRLQSEHDTAKTVDDFRQRLRKYLDHGTFGN